MSTAIVWDEADNVGDETLALELPHYYAGGVHGWRFARRARHGDRSWLDDYRRRRDRLFGEERTPFAGDIWMASGAVEALVLIGERDEAHRLYPALLKALKDGLITNGGGLTEGALAVSAGAGREWDTAQEHFETALRQAKDIPHRIAQPEVRRWYAWMLLDRDASGDREKARALLGEAIEMYAAIGMPKHIEIAERMLEHA